MARTLSIDLRERVISAVNKGLSRRAAAERFGIAPSTAIRWVQGWQETGRPDPKPRGGDRHSHRIETHADELIELVEDTPDITLAELAEHLLARHGLRVASSTVWRCLDRHGFTFKKNGARQRTAKT